MHSSVFDEVREACKAVAARARHVRIDADRLEQYAVSLPLEQASAAKLDPRYHYLGEPDDTVAYVLTLDAINFGSGYFPHLRKLPGLSGYFTVASLLKRHFESHGPFTAEALTRLTADDCATTFEQDPDGGPRSELMGLFASALNEFGRYLVDRFVGQFTSLVKAAQNSAERLVRLLAQLRYFQDVAHYDGLSVPFYKRAQLTAADLALALEGQALGCFEDLHRLTIFADNLVPHVLRADGVLRYSEPLASAIDAEELIPSGSAEEVEIRAVAVHAVELLVAESHRAGHNATAMKLDYLLWSRGQLPLYKARPRHRTRTVFY